MAEPRGQDGESVREMLDESAFYAARGARAPAQFVSRKVGVWNVIRRMYDRVQFESLSFDDSSYVQRADIRGNPGTVCLQGILDRGAKVRQITTNSGLVADRQVRCIQAGIGGQAWTVPKIPCKLLVLDRRVAVVAANMEVLTDGVLLVRDQVVVDAMVAMHHAIQGIAEPFRPAPLLEPPAHLVAVMDLLLSGETDENAAARLGMSSRTYCRRVTELLGELGVRTRFQAGAEAARRGWV